MPPGYLYMWDSTAVLKFLAVKLFNWKKNFKTICEVRDTCRDERWLLKQAEKSDDF